MINFKRILFPVDLSKQGHEAVPFVEAMAQRFQSEVILLHVAELPWSWTTPAEGSVLESLVDPTALMKERRDQLNVYLSDHFQGIRVMRILEQGSAARAITECALNQKADLIMMPTHGYGPFRSLLLGSVAAKVLHDTECPVWTGVHTDQMWSQKGAGWRRFLCAVDEDARDAPLLRWAAQFSCEQQVDLQVVHAVHAAAPIPAGEESGSLRDFLLGAARERLVKLQSDAGTNFDIWLRFGLVGHVVREAAIECHADLVLTGRGVIQKTFGRLRSSAYAVIRESPCPVISL
jgi:nucleotide-binding universal stress UspA family protein